MTRLNRRQLIKGSLAAAGCALAPRGLVDAHAQASFAPFLLTVYCSGGWDPTMVFDPKVGSGYASQEPGASVATTALGMKYVTHANRPGVKTWFDNFGANAAIVNGLSAASMTRDVAVTNMMTVLPPGKTRRVDWASHYVSALNPILEMPHVVLNAPYVPGDYTGISVRLSKEGLASYGTPVAGADPLGADGETALAAFRRATITSKIAEGAGPGSLDAEKLKALYYASARDPLIAARIPTVLQGLGPQGGETDFVRHGKIAVELFASGYSQAVTVQAGADGQWETQANHYARHAANYEMLFSGLNAIFAHAAAKGVLARTLVIVMSERGRNPRLNSAGGKGAWPFTSCMLWGPGIRGGAVAGVSDDALRGLPVNPMFGTTGDPNAITFTMANVMAAVYLKTDVPWKLILPDTKPITQIITATA